MRRTGGSPTIINLRATAQVAAGQTAQRSAPEAIGGSNDKRGAVSYQASDATPVDRPRPVARLAMSGGSGTASRVDADKLRTSQAGLKVDLVAPKGTLFNLWAGTVTRRKGLAHAPAPGYAPPPAR